MSWIHKLQKGDIVKSGTGRMRVVRNVTHGKRTVVSFAIAHCSWTGRAYTVLTESDLRTLGYRPTGIRYGLRTQLDKKREFEICHRGSGAPEITCCDVKDIA
jgi:hypothetical protein